MHRTNIYLTEEQVEALESRSRHEGVSRAEIVRRVLDAGLGLAGEEQDDVAAVAATSGIWASRSEEELAELLAWRSSDRFDRLGL